MDIDSSFIKLKQNNGQDSESGESDFAPSKSTSKVIKNFMKCVGTLIQHVENVFPNSSTLHIVNNSSKVTSNDGNDIDIVEHCIKQDPDNSSHYLRSVKKCILQLCLICLGQNIQVNCDLSFNKIDFYNCLEDSTRSLVINYLTENVVYVIEHIGFIIRMFKEETAYEEAKDIRKSLMKIYKQILLIPLNPNLDETPEAFQELDSSLWYSESIQNLTEKLYLLRTALIKFKKAFKKRILDFNFEGTDNEGEFFQNISLTPSKRKNNVSPGPNAKRMKQESDHVFRVPNIPPPHSKTNEVSSESDIKKSQKKKNKVQPETSGDEISIITTNESDPENIKKKKKQKSVTENKENETISINSDTESKKKKHKIKSKTNVNEISVITSDESSSENIQIKKKQKSIRENDTISVNSDTETVKKKHKMKSKINRDEISVILTDESDSENIKMKKKHKMKSKMNGDEISVILTDESDSERNKIKKKHKFITENESRHVNIDTESVKKKKKLKIKPKTNGDEISIITTGENDSKNIKKKKKQKSVAENETISINSDSESVKKKKKHKIKSKINGDEISVIITDESDSENVKMKQKQKSMTENEIISVNSDTESVKKKKKLKAKSKKDVGEISVLITNESDCENITENKKNEIMYVNSDTESVKKKHKTKSENNEIIVDSDTENIKERKKHNTKLNENQSRPEIRKIIDEKDMVEKTKLNTDEGSKCCDSKENSLHQDEQNNKKKNKSRNESESSVINIGCIFSSHLEIEDAEMSINSTLEKNHDKSKEKETNENTPQPDNDTVTKQLDDSGHKLKKSKIVKKNKKNIEDDDFTYEIFGALTRGEIEVDYEDDAENIYTKITEENNLNQNEKFLYLQNMLLEAKENNKLSDDMKEKLSNLKVTVNWDIPLAHTIESRLSAGPLPEEQKALDAIGVSDKRLFNLDEDKTIRNNWKEFCKLHELEDNPTPFLMLRHGKKAYLKFQERKKFVQFLGKGLPNRPLHCIYRRFKVLFTDKEKRGRFTLEEDQVILTYCNKMISDQHKFAALASILNRTRPSIECRYRRLIAQNNNRTVWNLEVESDLVNGLLKAISSKDVRDLRDTKLTKEHYKEVAAAMDIPWLKVKIHWLKCIYTKLFSPKPLNSGYIRAKLIQLLIDSGLTDAKKVDWNEIANHFQGITKEFLWGQLNSAQLKVCNKKDRKNFGRCLQYFQTYLQTQRENGITPFSSKTIKRYEMTEEGKLKAYD